MDYKKIEKDLNNILNMFQNFEIDSHEIITDIIFVL